MKISLGTTYYNNPQNILQFVDHHHDYVDELLIVDDCSDDIYNIRSYVKPSEKIKIYRVKKDYGFNSHGCRNLIMKEAENDFVILLDSDRMILDPEISLDVIKSKKLKYDVLYRFKAHVLRLGNGVHASVNDFLISKNFFFSAGGYDEEWIGYRNGDRQYFKQLEHFGSEDVMKEINLLITRKPSLKLDDDVLLSKNDVQRLSREKLNVVERRIISPEPKKRILTFEWERISE